jgi:uncharacterized protein
VNKDKKFINKEKRKKNMEEFNTKKRKIFDAHCHIGLFGKQNIRNTTIEPFKDREIYDIKTLKKHIEEKKINKAIIVPHYTFDQKTAFENNKKILEIISKIENIYGGIWANPLPTETEKNKKALEIIPNKKIIAIKICPQAWPKGKYTMDPDTWDSEFAENMKNIIYCTKKHNLIIQMHTGTGNSDIRHYSKFVDEFGNGLRIQFIHMGSSPGGHFSFIPRFIDWLKKGYDFYCDTAESRGFAASWLVKTMEKEYPEGINRILFASDNPWGMFESEYWKVEGIKCSEEIKNKIFYSNTCKAYNIKE